MLRTIQALARRGGAPAGLSIVTTQAQAIDRGEPVSPVGASLWGLGRVAALEHPELKCRLIDLPAGEDVTAHLREELLSAGDEKQVAYRHNERFVARLRRGTGQNGNSHAAEENDTEIVIPAGEPSRLRLAQAGSFDGLTVDACQPIELPAGHVEIEVRATGLNFSDVLKALGLYPGIKDDVVPLLRRDGVQRVPHSHLVQRTACVLLSGFLKNLIDEQC